MQLVERQSTLARAHEDELLAGLRRGDESAFAELVDAYTPALTAVAIRYVGSRAVAEEVVQEAWLRFLRGIAGFEQRSSPQDLAVRDPHQRRPLARAQRTPQRPLLV